MKYPFSCLATYISSESTLFAINRVVPAVFLLMLSCYFSKYNFQSLFIWSTIYWLFFLSCWLVYQSNCCVFFSNLCFLSACIWMPSSLLVLRIFIPSECECGFNFIYPGWEPLFLLIARNLSRIWTHCWHYHVKYSLPPLHSL